MMFPEVEAGDIELNQIQVQNRIEYDGRLVAPIDLSLENVHKIKLHPLVWNHLDDPPTKMKITNTGETVIVSGKWGTQRPYVKGGPLVGNYVFSQIHFHWGENEHEGSEHTVRGIAYPMEMHVVLFKSRYLTQEAALKNADGVVIFNYLVKLSNKSSSILQWLGNKLENIEKPKTHLMLDPTPLSSILVPMTKDYLIYWGALATDHCSHTIMWIISRAALAITVEDLNKFRKLQNTRSEFMKKNFREAATQQGRIIFHVNPSIECDNLLLPGTIEPPGKPLLVNYSHMPELDIRQAKSIFNSGIGDCSEKVDDKVPTETTDDKIKNSSKKIISKGERNVSKLRNNSVDCGSTEKQAKIRVASRSPKTKSRLQKRNPTDQHIDIEKEKKKTQNDPQQDQKIKEEKVEEKKNEEHLNICISKVSMSADSSIETPITEGNKPKSPQISHKNPQNKQKTVTKKSQLPIPKNTKGLKSSLAQYFKTRPESASSEKPTQKVMTKPTTPSPKARSVTTSIPKPIGINAGKLNSKNETN